MNQAWSVWSFKELELIKQTWMENFESSRSYIYQHTVFIIFLWKHVPPAQLKNTLRMYLFLNERTWMLLKLIATHSAWSKIARHLYNKSIQQYSRLGEDVSSLAFFSLSFQQIPSYSWYTGLLFSQTSLFPSNQPTFPHGWGTPAFLHLFNCWHVKKDEQGLCFLLWEDQKIRVKWDARKGLRVVWLTVTAWRASWCSSVPPDLPEQQQQQQQGEEVDKCSGQHLDACAKLPPGYSSSPLLWAKWVTPTSNSSHCYCRIIVREQHKLERTSKYHLVQRFMGRMRLCRTLSNPILKTSSEGDSTMSLGRLFQSMIILTVKNFLLTLIWSLFPLIPGSN